MSEMHSIVRSLRYCPDGCINRLVGLTALFSLAVVNSAGAQNSGPEAVWTPSSEAPDGTLSHQLEMDRHDFFIELSEAGNIDLVFFGTTEAEMWWWDARGQAVWEREFGSLNAANFGSQGTQPKSLLWRMQNGELAGYAAKLIVMQAGMSQVAENYPADYVPGYAALLDEIRLRQPQAKVLLFAPLPRGRPIAAQRQWAAANAAAFDRYVDDETIFYLDIGESFYRPDGSFNGQTWSDSFSNRGTQTTAYEIWAEELQPWLDRFVR
jgi:hypothetical protein